MALATSHALWWCFYQPINHIKVSAYHGPSRAYQ